jgi:putative heme iron utilization protein
MTVDNSSHQAARAARRLMRTALKGALATLDHRDPSRPYVSLVLVATEPDGTPITLISNLALHTRNLERNARASLLIDGTEGLEDPLTGARVTLVGRAAPTRSGTALRRFLARHPSAETYAGFPDFRPFALEVTAAHFIGGFGRIVDLSPAVVATDISGADDLLDGEANLILQLSEQLADVIAAHPGFEPGGSGTLRISGIDPDGADLLHRNRVLRVEFGRRVTTSAEARDALRAALQAGRGV